ncbi:hypothetical protein PAXRUDRAFT_87892, partial [Paxillus rubicundulus Ve08.2h10]
LQQGDITFISSILDANPTLYLDEIQNRLSHKQLSKTASERNELLRATWQAEYGDIPMECFVWIDESSVDDKTNQ